MFTLTLCTQRWQSVLADSQSGEAARILSRLCSKEAAYG